MFNELYQSFPVFASLDQIFHQLAAKITLAPPRRRNGVGISLNLPVRQPAELFLERAEIQPSAPQARVKYMLFQKLKSFWLFRRLPRFGRSADDWPGQKRKRLLMV
jgi:hypothetical protein